jgi:hypothetical protein
MPRPDEGMIHAWLDGELEAETAARVAKLVEEDVEWGAAAAEARGLIAASSRILEALDTVPGDVIPAGSRAAPMGGSAAPRDRNHRFAVRPWMRVAAGLALVAGTAYVVRTGGSAAPESLATSPAASAETRAADVGTATPERRDGPAAPPATAPSSLERERQPASQVDSAVGTQAIAPQPGGAAVDMSDAVNAGSQDRSVSQFATVRSEKDSATVARSAGRVVDSSSAGRRVQALAEPLQLGGVAAAEAAGAARAPMAKSAMMADRSVSPPPVISGCWRTETAAPADSVLVDPRVLRRSGDTLVIVVTTTGSQATVVRTEGSTGRADALAVRPDGPELRGTARGAGGTPVPFRATLVSCPRAP